MSSGEIRERERDSLSYNQVRMQQATLLNRKRMSTFHSGSLSPQGYALFAAASPVKYRSVAQAGIFGARPAVATINKPQLLCLSERRAAHCDDALTA